jgi:hypothetical protein
MKLVFHISVDGSEINTIKRAIMASQFLITHLNHALREYSILESRYLNISSIRIATTRIALRVSRNSIGNAIREPSRSTRQTRSILDV